VFLSVSFPQAIFHPMKVGNGKNIEWWEYYHFSTRTVIAIKHETFYITNDDKYVTFKIPALDLKIPIFSLFPESTVYIEFNEEQAKILPYVSSDEVSSGIIKNNETENNSQQEQEQESVKQLFKLQKFMEKYKSYTNSNENEKSKNENKLISILVIDKIQDMIDAIKYISIQYAR
jgi:ssDNA-binding Zn-finger/Zn-ribbon topoisomerase 1